MGVSLQYDEPINEFGGKRKEMRTQRQDVKKNRRTEKIEQKKLKTEEKKLKVESLRQDVVAKGIDNKTAEVVLMQTSTTEVGNVSRPAPDIETPPFKQVDVSKSLDASSPALQQNTPSPASPDSPASAPEEEKADKQKKQKMLIWGAAILVGLLLLLLALYLFTAGKKKDEDED